MDPKCDPRDGCKREVGGDRTQTEAGRHEKAEAESNGRLPIPGSPGHSPHLKILNSIASFARWGNSHKSQG